MRIVFFYFVFFSMSSFACTMMSANGSRLSSDRVNVWVSSDALCSDADITGDELVSLVDQAANSFWNTISSSRLRFVSAGFWNQNLSRFSNGKLCTPGEDCTSTTVPITTDIIVSCNSNTQNFSSSTYAKTAIYIDGSSITGANILINNTAGSVFGNLTKRQKLWVIAHELGHAAGLGHSKNSSSLMYFTLTPERVYLSEEDYWGMTFLYPAKQDGCGLIGSININKPTNTNWWLSFFVGIFLLISSVVVQKIFLKRFKFIF